MTPQITLKRGTPLAMIIRPKADGEVVPMPEGATVAAGLTPAAGGEVIDLSPVIEDDVIRINYDTLDLPLDLYTLDFRITLAGEGDQWSETIRLQLTKSIANPSPRP